MEEKPLNEIVCDVFWEGSHKWEEQPQFNDGHVLYAIYGTHPLYGRDALVYIGRTEAGLQRRFYQHDDWVRFEPDYVTVKFASIKAFDSVRDWRRSTNSDKEPTTHDKADSKTIAAVESLLIIAHQPAFNTSEKNRETVLEGLRVFNTGKRGLLHPELSWAYFDELDEK